MQCYLGNQLQLTHIYIPGTHFDAVTIRTDNNIASRTVTVRNSGGGSDNADADSVVRVLADREREAGQFTDKGSMVLKCKQCGHIMHGDYEVCMCVYMYFREAHNFNIHIWSHILFHLMQPEWPHTCTYHLQAQCHAGESGHKEFVLAK